jgi:hydrogenase maturation protease
VVLGIGNSLLTDDGAGIHAIDFLREFYPETEGVEYVDGGTLNFTLADTVGRADQLIVIDAARFDAEPGTVRCLMDAELDRYLSKSGHSAHEVGLSDLLDIARLTGVAPRRRVLIGIQAQSMDWGTQPTPAIVAALPTVAKQVTSLIDEWRQCPDKSTPAAGGAMHVA